MRPSRLLAAAVTAAALLAAPSAAQAQQLAWQPCPDEGFGAFQCASSPQPLDHANPSGGAINLFVRRLVAPTPTPATTALVALAGGPGQAAAPLAGDFAEALATGLKDRDLLVFDQRGTGKSGALACDALEGSSSSASAVTRCANELGPRRGFYRTADTVEDLETLRVQGGYTKLALFGVSYGTKVALDYAARYPQNVDRLILDSVVLPEGPDPLQVSSFRAVPRVLRELCAGSRCKGATPNPVNDIRTLVRRDKLIRGRYVDSTGRKRSAGLRPETIYSLLGAGDLNPAWRALTPGAVRAAVKGDTAPLIRLAAAALSVQRGSTATAATAAPATQLQSIDDAGNPALYLSTLCEESRFPWDRNAGTDARVDQATAALTRQPSSAFTPFTRKASAASGGLSVCIGWPNASPAPAAPAALPQVPTLILSGSADLRTPAEDAAAVAARIPGATVVTVPNVGHSVVGVDASGCAGAAIAGFFNGQGVTPCPASRPLIPPLERPAASLRSLPTTGPYKGTVGRTVTAVVRTRVDALARALGAQFDGAGGRFGGLRGGTITVSASAITLRSDTFVPGVTVSGGIDAKGNGRLTIRGSRAARGTLSFTNDGRQMTGTLSGRKIRLRARASAASAGTASPTPATARAEIPFPALVAPEPPISSATR